MAEPLPPAELSLAGKIYRVYRLNAFDQGHVARRIAPLLPTLLPIFLQIAKVATPEKLNKGKVSEEILALLERPDVLQPFCNALSELDDEKYEYVVSKCLSAIRGTRNDQDWLPIWNGAQKRAMFREFDDSSFQLQATVFVIKDSLGSFISGLATSAGITPAAAE